MGDVIPFPLLRRWADVPSSQADGLMPLYVDGMPGMGASLEEWESFRWRLTEFDPAHPEVRGAIRTAEIMMAIKRQQIEGVERATTVFGCMDQRA